MKTMLAKIISLSTIMNIIKNRVVFALLVLFMLLNASAAFGQSFEDRPGSDCIGGPPFLDTGVVQGVSNTGWRTVSLFREYNSMVVVASPNYDANTVPLIVRLQNAEGDSFEVRVDRTDGSPDPVEGVDIYYLVVEEGVYTEAVHGVKMEAIKFSSTSTDRVGSWIGQKREYANTYNKPVVVGQVMSFNDTDFSVFWARGSKRRDPPSSSTLRVGKHVGEDPNIIRLNETVSYVVIEAGSGTIGETAYTAGLGADIVRGMYGASPYSYALAGLSTAATAIVSQAGMDGSNGGWAVLCGPAPFSESSLNLAIDEDQARDAERNHTTEQVAYIVFAPAGTLVSIEVAPSAVWIGTGSNQQFTAIGIYDDGTSQDVTSSADWTSSDASIATVTASGLAWAVGDGTTNITASFGSVSNSAPLTSIDGGWVSCSVRELDMNILVISQDGNEPALPAIQQALEYIGVPYTLYINDDDPNWLTGDVLGGCHGKYQGIILTDGGIHYGASWAGILDTYAARHNIRTINWYTWPTPDWGFDTSDTPEGSAEPRTAVFTPNGSDLFLYINTNNPLAITNAWTYLAPPAENATPLLIDADGHGLAVLYSWPWNGREFLTMTFNSNAYLQHIQVLSFGLVNWVTRGIFLGERHIFLGVQVDDVFIEDAEWTPDTPCGTDPELTGYSYRITGDDLQTVIDWLAAKQAQAAIQNLQFDLVFNGKGATRRAYKPDTLTPKARANQALFKWINHSFDHRNLDSVSYRVAKRTIRKNNVMAVKLRLDQYSTENMVTPEVSGLTNPRFLQAAFDLGIRYLVTDTSRPGYDNPSPNAGIYNSLQPDILMIPRRPTNLFYNVSTPDEWVAEYNCIYRDFWGQDLTFDEILDEESDAIVGYLLKGDLDPLMFHEMNLRSYLDASGENCFLLGELLDAVFTKYNNFYNLPILSPTMDEIGRRMAQRIAYNQASVTATIIPGLSITITAQQPVTVPVTGLASAGAEAYGGQPITYVDLEAGQSITLPIP